MNSLMTRFQLIKLINCARRNLKNNKACGPDYIINEFIKNSPYYYTILFVVYLILFLTQVVFLQTVLQATLFLFIKIRDDPNYYRGITLLSALGKLFTSILNTRITNFVDNIGLLGEEQAGFSKLFNNGSYLHIKQHY